MQRRFLVGSAVSLLLTSVTARAGVRPVAVSGGSASNTSNGERFHRFESVQLNNRGEVGFFAALANTAGEPLFFDAGGGLGSTPDVGIWVQGGADSRLIARQGRDAPASPAGTPLWLIDPADSDDSVYDYRLSDAGVLLRADTAPNRSKPTVWLLPDGAPAIPLAASGEVAPGTDLKFAGLAISQLTDSGHALLTASLSPDGNPSGDAAAYGHFSFSAAGGLTPVVRTGMPAVGLPSPAAFDSIFISPPAINERGTAVFVSEIAPSAGESSIGSSDSGEPTGVWLGMRDNALSLLARSTDDDGMGAGLGRFTAPAINERGDVAVISRHLHGASLYRDGQHRLLARGDGPAPGAPGRTFFTIEAVELSETGKVAMSALLWNEETNSPDGVGVWEDIGGGLLPVALPAMAAPTGDGGVFVSVDGHTLAINDAGQVLFEARFRRIGEDARQGVFAQDRQGALRAIALGGDLLTIADGDARTIQSLGGSAINDIGQVVFQAHFTDGSQGIFLSDVVAVPEPSVIWLAAGGVMAGWIRPRKRG